MKLDSQETIKVLDALIGRTEAVGDSWEDEKIEENLRTLIDVINWCLDGVYQSSSTRDSVEYSMRVVGSRAYEALLDYKKWLDEMLDEVE